MTEANAINAATTGIVGNTGTSFTGTPVTQYNVLTGASTTSTLNNVAPSATSGVPLISQGSSSQPVFGTAVVAGGGTGATSFTTNGAVISNTTSTGALAAVALSSQKFLVGNSGAPTAKALSINIQAFSSSGTYTPTSGMVYCIIECIGDGGGGGGTASAAAATYSGGGGGGGGAYARKFASSATIGASQTVTVGTGGSGGASGNHNGSAGSGTSLGSICVAAGGGGGGGNGGSSIVTGGTGGSGTTGDFTLSGFPGVAFYANTVGWGITLLGIGGSSGAGFGSGGMVPSTTPATGGNGFNYGGGGGGGSSFNANGAAAGGNGAPGLVIITEYIIS